MNKPKELLIKLMNTIHCTHLDMGGNDRYTLTHKSLPVIKEIKLYFFKEECLNDDDENKVNIKTK